ncbi:MAG: LysR family transcriptional regulator [Actinobacteria bacterium]|nr:LysR family transcriptional regulator [Actinomycetota bacterium]
MPDLRQLRALQAVAESGSFSRAADMLNYTQPAVSKTIAALERDLGAVLVERECRPVRLTDAGMALARHADEVFARLSSARAEIDAITRLDGGNLCVGTFGSAASSFVVRSLCEFRRLHPRVRIGLVDGQPEALVRQLRAGKLDLAAVFDYPAAGHDVGDGLELHHLLDQPYDIVLPLMHPLAQHDAVRPADLADDDWLLPDVGAGNPMMKLLRRMFEAAGFEPRVAFTVNDCKMVLAMVAAGGGVSIVPRLMIDPLPADVAVRPVTGERPVQRVSVARLPGRYLSPASAAFLAMLRQAARRRAESWI